MPIELVYPTPIYKNKTTDEKIHQEIQGAVNSETFEYNNWWGKTHQLSTSGDVIDKYSMTTFKSWIETCLVDYFQALNPPSKQEYRMESWIAYFPPGDYAHIHSHGHADISGVFYHKTNGNDGDFWLENPVIQTEQNTCYTQENIKYKPEQGALMMFPGYLKHGVLRNQSETTRISVSFNIYFNA